MSRVLLRQRREEFRRVFRRTSTDIRGRHVIIAEDITIQGHAEVNTSGNLQSRERRRLRWRRSCARTRLPRLTSRAAISASSALTSFIVGYGLDFAEHYHLPK